MPSIPFADNFLAGSIISLLMPVGLLIVIAIWYVLAVRRFPDGSRRSSQPPPRATEPQPGAAGTQPESTGSEP